MNALVGATGAMNELSGETAVLRDVAAKRHVKDKEEGVWRELVEAFEAIDFTVSTPELLASADPIGAAATAGVVVDLPSPPPITPEQAVSSQLQRHDFDKDQLLWRVAEAEANRDGLALSLAAANAGLTRAVADLDATRNDLAAAKQQLRTMAEADRVARERNTHQQSLIAALQESLDAAKAETDKVRQAFAKLAEIYRRENEARKLANRECEEMDAARSRLEARLLQTQTDEQIALRRVAELSLMTSQSEARDGGSSEHRIVGHSRPQTDRSTAASVPARKPSDPLDELESLIRSSTAAARPAATLPASGEAVTYDGLHLKPANDKVAASLKSA